MFKRIWNLIKGIDPNDLNGDGKVDIKDKMIEAERKTAKEITQFKPSIDHNGDGVDLSEGPYKNQWLKQSAREGGKTEERNMIDFFLLIGKLISVVPVIVTICSFIAAITPTPVDDGWMKKVYMVMDWCALNVWKAKDKQVIP